MTGDDERQQHVIYSARDLLDLEDDPNRWIVPNMIPRAQRTLVFGAGGTFKSTVIFDLAVAVSAKRLLFQQFPVQIYGPVLVNSTEGNLFESKRRILAHARAHDVNPAEIPLYFCQQPFCLDERGDVAALEQVMQELKPVMVVLDPLDSFFSGDENSAKETKAVRRTVDRLIRTYDTAFIIIHHETKSQEKPTPRGSGAWYGWVDAVLHVKTKSLNIPGVATPQQNVEINSLKQRNGETGRVFSGVPNIDKTLDTVTFSFYDGKDTSGIVRLYIKQQVYRTMLDYKGPMTNKMLCDILGLRPERISEAMEELEATGLAVKDGELERPFGPNGSKTRVVKGWQAVRRATLVDNALIMSKAMQSYEKQFDDEYAIIPEIEGEEPTYEALYEGPILEAG